MVDQARILRNIALAKKGFRAAAAAGFDLDVIDGYDRVHGRAAFVRALKPAPLPHSIFRGDDEGERRRTTSHALKVEPWGGLDASNVSMVEFRALWMKLKPIVPAAATKMPKTPKLDTAIALKQSNAVQVPHVSEAIRVH